MSKEIEDQLIQKERGGTLPLNKLLHKSTIRYIGRILKFKFQNCSNFSELDKNQKQILKTIKKDGYAIIPNFVDKKFCENCIQDIDWMLENKKKFVQQYSDLRIFGAEHLSKNIKQFAENEYLSKLANAHNGVKTFNAFTLANRIIHSSLSSKLGSGGGWHRDSNIRQFKAILYLNDVNEKNGAYQIIKHSHKLSSFIPDSKNGKLSLGMIRFSDNQINKIIEKNPERLQTIIGKAGTLIVKDCSCIHRGSPLQEGHRYALTNYCFDKTIIDQNMVDRFSPIVNPDYTLDLGK